jgi:hypothetical protein
VHEKPLSTVVRSRIRHLDPGCFAVVMATGIVSIDVGQHGWTTLARALFAVNLVTYAVLLVMSTLRLLRFPRELLADFVSPGRGAGFLTLAAATCVLGSQCLLVAPLPRLADGLLLAGALSWQVSSTCFSPPPSPRASSPVSPAASTAAGWWPVVGAKPQAAAKGLRRPRVRPVPCGGANRGANPRRRKTAIPPGSHGYPPPL